MRARDSSTCRAGCRSARRCAQASRDKRVWRYNELRRELKGISHKMLTQQLRELEADGLISRTVHPVVPPHVDDAITPLGRTTVPAIEALRDWGGTYRRRRQAQQGAR